MRSVIAALVASFATFTTIGVTATPLKRGATSNSPFYVPTKWPTVPFEVPESWAGLLPVTPAHAKNETLEYFFWYFESESAKGKDDLVIWLNGGPGCSSLEGLLQENGPVLFPWNITGQPDEPYVKLNPHSWTQVANVLWVEQPVPTGFSQSNADAFGELGVAEEFYHFILNFYDHFPESRGKRLWLTGESYAGMYIPYIAHHIYHAQHHDAKYGVDLKGLHLDDPSFTGDFFGSEAAAPAFAKKYEDLLQLPESFLKGFYAEAEANHLMDYVEKNLVYPPPEEGLQIPYTNKSYSPWSDFSTAATEVNPNFNVYDVGQSVNILDPLGFPPAAAGPNTKNILNDIPGFKKLIHAPENVQWIECTNNNVFAGQNGDISLPPDQTVLASVIDKNVRTTIAHGERDAVLLDNGTQLAIQNLTWGGKRGFQIKPHQFVEINGTKEAKFHTERGLTFIEVYNSGHMWIQFKRQLGLKALDHLVHGTSLDSEK